MSDFSFPELRFGGVYGSHNRVHEVQAKALVQLILASSTKYADVTRSALQALHVPSSSIRIEAGAVRKIEDSVLNFPLFSFASEGYRVEGRLSVTVCQKWRRSKIWVRLTWISVDPKNTPATGLRAEDVQAYLQTAGHFADEIESQVARLYHEQARSQGFDVIDERLHVLKIRTFNSRQENSKRLHDELRSRRSLASAFRHQEYRRELLDFFEIALDADDEDASQERVLHSLREGEFEFFRYFDKDDIYRTVVAASTFGASTNLCAYGFDATNEHFRKSTSHRAGVGLAREYGSQF